MLVPVLAAIVGCGTGARTDSAPSGPRATVALEASSSSTPVSVGNATMRPPPIYVSDLESDSVRLPGNPTPIAPLLHFVNDTADTLTIRRLDDPSVPDVILEPRARFITSWGGQFFGGPSAPEQRREALKRGAGVMIGVFDQAGQLRGRILFTPEYLFGRIYDWLCLSNAAEPPWVVDSSRVHQTHPCR